MTIQMIREVAHKVLLGVYPALDMLEYGKYSVEDVLDQIVMELMRDLFDTLTVNLPSPQENS